MEQLYAESGCRPKGSPKDLVLKGLIGIVGAICAFLVLFSGQIIFSILGMSGIIILVFLFPRLNIEYEYIFCDGQFDFDKIMGGNKRKNILKVDMDNIEIIGPAKAPEIGNSRDFTIKDFSSREEGANVYAILTKIEEKKVKILFEPSAKMIEAMRMKSPRKVLKS